MNIQKDILENETILSLQGWLDTEAAGDFGRELEAFEDDGRTLVLNLKDLEYISSSGVRQIVAAHKKMGGNFVVRNTPDNVFNVFKSIGIDKRVKFE
jgi:anti-anti-sigma factor